MLEKLSKGITSVLVVLCSITVVGLTLIVALQVVTRLMNISLPWTEELARFFLIWLTFLGCSLALQQESHLSVDFFVNLAPKKVKLVIGLFIRVLMFIFFGVLLVYVIKLSILSIDTPSSSLQWPMGLIYGILPISGVISMFYVVIDTIKFVKGKEDVTA